MDLKLIIKRKREKQIMYDLEMRVKYWSGDIRRIKIEGSPA